MICLFPGVVHAGIKTGLGVNEAACWVYDYKLPLKTFSPCHFYNECKHKAESNYSEFEVIRINLYLDIKI